MEGNGKSGLGGGMHSNNLNNNNNSDNEHRQLVAEEEEKEEEDEDKRQGNSNLSDDDDDDGGGGGESEIFMFPDRARIEAYVRRFRTRQERARENLMPRMNNEGSSYWTWWASERESYLQFDDDGSYYWRWWASERESYLQFDDDDNDDDDNDDFDDQPDDTHEVNGNAEHQYDESVADDNVDGFDAAEFSSDEAYARASQDAEEREMARLLALVGIRDRQAEHTDDHGGNSQDTWEEVDPDELSYEELLALGDVIGTESRGLSADAISSLPSIKYELGNNQNGSNDSCVICCEDYEDGEILTILSCKHTYHSDCINNWLKISKACPICRAEVSTAGHS